MPQDYTRRPDLEALPIQRPPVIGHHLFPWFEKPNQTGDIYYMPYNADKPAQKGRNTAAIATIDEETIANAHKSFNASEILGRRRAGYDQIDSYGGVEGVDLALAKLAARAFYNEVEIDIAQLVLENDNAIDATDDVVAAIEDEVSELEDLADGDVCLAISHSIFTKLKKDPVVKDRMKYTGILQGAGGDPRKVTAEQLASILGVARIYVGKNKQWRRSVSAPYRGNGCLFVEPDDSEDPAEEVQLGRIVYQAWDNQIRHFMIGTWFDPKSRAHYADAVGKIDIMTFNSVLMTPIQIFAADESDSDSDSESN